MRRLVLGVLAFLVLVPVAHGAGYNIEVVAGNGLTNNTGAPDFTPTGNDSQIGADLINARLDAGENVILDTTGDAAGTQAGSITVSAAITKSAAVASSLSFDADSFVDVNATLAGGFNLTVTGDAVFNDEVGSAAALSSLHVTGTPSRQRRRPGRHDRRPGL